MIMLQQPSDLTVQAHTPEQDPPTTPTPSRLGQAAVRLAQSHTIIAEGGKPHTLADELSLPARLPLLRRFLRNAHQALATSADEALTTSYAAEWLLDNFYAVEQALRQVKEDLPTRYYQELPKLQTPESLAGYPRVYALARAFLIFEEYQFDLERFVRFVLAYQQPTAPTRASTTADPLASPANSLTMGELWALPIMLRFVLLEDLALAAQRIAALEEAKRYPAIEPSTMEDADLIASVIPNLRQLDTQDWEDFFERVSLVHQFLCDDPMGAYARMDFPTRNQYRTVIEKLAVATTVAEPRVAQLAIELARTAYAAELALDGAPRAEQSLQGAHQSHATSRSSLNLALPRPCHVGYYLLDEGLQELEQRLHYRPQGWARVQRWILRHPTRVYLGINLLSTLIILALVTLYGVQLGAMGWGITGALLLTLVPALTLAANFSNWLVTHLLPPRVLPKLDFAAGIPAFCRTMVVIPALVANQSDIETLLNELEQHYLRNPDPYLTFALLSDFSDAAAPAMPEDAALLERARTLVTQLNARYPKQPFYFFHRERRWNPSEQSWLGWERKRGKLHEFNALLRGATDTSYTVQVGELAVLPRIRYVITLDADTVLPNEGAHRLIGTLAHPLNHAQFNPHTGKVTHGYTVLQPRAMIKPASANRSLFTRVFAGDMGLDLYTMAVSDVYQDLFGAGIYVGKGIYDVDAFERSLDRRVPENSLLSHDLFEGIHGRVGLVTDIVLYEDYPPHYLVNMARSHRWVRGDWQLLPWLLPTTPRQLDQGAMGKAPNDLALINRWKIADNLRRSLLAPALLLLFLAGWTILPGSPLFWTLLGLLTPAFSLIAGAVTGLFHAMTTTSGNPWQRFFYPLRNNALRWLLFLAFLPHEAILTLDAIGRTLVRLLLRRRKMLEWTTAARAVRLFGREVTVETTLLRMMPSLILVALFALLVSMVNPPAIFISGPFFLVWLLAAEIAYWISRPVATEMPPPTPEQRRKLRLLARRTWLFYEQFVGPNDNWLPPDHFQEAPRGVVAHRTSPTNVGLYLISMVAAHDLGYISTTDLKVRLRFTFDTLGRLTRHRGHFLNWIDTSSLQPLPPSYVSTVDSGNLAGCLIVLKQSCLAIPQQAVWRWQWWEGLLDTLALLTAAVHTTIAAKATPAVVNGSSQPAPVAEAEPFLAYLQELRSRIIAVRSQPEQWLPLLDTLVNTELQQLDQALADILENNAALFEIEILQEYRITVERIHQHLHTMARELSTLLPWLVAMQTPPPLFAAATAPADLRQHWQTLNEQLPRTPTWGDVATACVEGQQVLRQLCRTLEQRPAPADADAVATARAWCEDLAKRLGSAQTLVTTLLTDLATVATEADTLVAAMDFHFLYHPQRKVFHIGYNLDSGRLDNSYYDLLASEARIASLLAIAKHDVPQQHWLQLGRPLTKTTSGEQALLSWSGTMFEYLMPPLILRSYPDTLLHQSCRAAVAQQIDYGRTKGVPWGISESGFYTFDAAMNYQYRAFGVPGLGFKRGLSEDLVIAPYASLIALPIAPAAVLENIQRLEEIKAIGRYGCYEAIDFTAAHLPLGQDYAIVRSYMAHHQGMIMLALADYLQGKRMVERFHAEPMVQSVELLLQEQIPQGAPLQYPHEDEQQVLAPDKATAAIAPWSVPVDSPLPLLHSLSNGRYGLLLTNAGSGYSNQGDLRFTRWRADTTLDDWGSWLYLQDLERKLLWSAGRQPTGQHGDYEEVTFHPHMVEFRRRDHSIALQMAVTVAPDHDVEVRRVTLANESETTRRLGITSYAEVVLSASGADGRHPAFAKLFVESEYLPELGALLFRRRPRAATEAPQFLLHMLVRGQGPPEQSSPPLFYESDRARFLGRGHSARQPAALQNAAWWATDGQGVTGATLDPVMALGQTIELPPHSTVQLAWLTLTAPTREELLALARRFLAWSTIERTFLRARSQAERELRQLGFQGDLLQQIQQLLSLLYYPNAVQRAEPALLAANRLGQSSLWGFGISGDYPILLARMSSETEGELLHDLLLAHTYWRRRGIQIDLVILNQQDTNYGQNLQNAIHRLIRRLDSDGWVNQRGGIFILRADQMGEETRVLLQTAARVLLDGRQGSLAEQLADLQHQITPLPLLEPTLNHEDEADAKLAPLARPTDLRFDNGFGGFSPDGREYQIYLLPETSASLRAEAPETSASLRAEAPETSASAAANPPATTPAPWINVVANADFGFLATENGGGYTWAVNSGENRLTTWRNDPVTDLPAEALYLRDEETARFWSPMPQPAPAAAPYLVRHGAGYTVYEHNSHHLRQTVTLFVAPDAPVKIVKLRLENASATRPRRITATFYAEWVLGVNRESSQPFVVPEYEESRQALLAANYYNAEFGERVAFVAASKELHGLTADRTEFLGRLGTLQRPAALQRIGLASRVEAGVDPCAALQLHLDLPVGGSEEVWFIIGQGATRTESLELIRRFQAHEPVDAAWQAVHEQWDAILGTVTVQTPDAAMDLLLNRWLLYQALACRIWGRSALYQSSGAYGFRDQLQDMMALTHARPDLVRAHLLRSARHQFETGDVLHWWHPPSGRGVRTRMTDDLAWLPYVTAHYVLTTGDTGVLQERVRFLRGEPLGKDEEERYALYEPTPTSYTLYDHCRRALQRAVTAGEHGIPLMGAGDWNDGMNRVGIEGKGESIWLGWFLHGTLTTFAQLCATIQDAAQAEQYRAQAETIRQAIETHGWDGAWYRRAYYDDGSPLGSAQNSECQIDAIAQSWAVLTGAAAPERAQQAMNAVLERLVRWDDRLILLFTPPFDKTTRDPGYIKGYLPGIRENGGQYTHAALWTIWAFADLGQGDRAEELFRLINPIYRSDSPAKADHYKVEPYVIAADVYGVPPHGGRGGWTWYTGSSGWMYRLGIEAILGLRREGTALILNPCIPKAWPSFTLTYRYGQSTYTIRVENPHGVNRGVQQVTLDGAPLSTARLPLTDDGQTHQVMVTLGA
ncbi:MAG: hypothetical protein KF832_08130 [Caldilineaceae bacterium]|nr:hypothetical protein [Caldilineaceae bacterium]